jgi:hypothetical protein
MLAKTLIALLTVSTVLAVPGIAKADVEIQNGNTRMSVGGGRVDIQKDSDVVTGYRYPVYYDWKTRSIRIPLGRQRVRVVRPKSWCERQGYSQERYQSRSSGNVQIYSSSSTTVCR